MNKLLKKNAMILFSVLSLLLVACERDKPAQKLDPSKNQGVAEPVFRKEGELEFVTAAGDRHRIDVEIADTDADRSFGLMYRKKMEPNRGMLFIFEVEGPQAFWMKNTFIPLDIIYVNAQMQIVSIAENATPFSEESLPSRGPAIYVVEVNGGFCKEKGIKAGDIISYQVAI